MSLKQINILISFLVISLSCFSQEYITTKSKEKKINHIIYLLGDIKYSKAGQHNLSVLKKYIDKEKENSTVVILGDIVYPSGLPDSLDTEYKITAKCLAHVLHTFDDYKGNVYFLSGNHDWERGRKKGWDFVKNEENYIEKYFNNKNLYLPDKGCPGPIEVSLSTDITLIIFNSQWWLHQNNKPDASACGFTNKSDIFIQLEDILRRNKDKKILFATHHPLYSAGEHGGHFPASALLFPLLGNNNNNYIPLPGFLYTSYRKYLGDIQDLAHPEYKFLKEKLLAVFEKYPNIIYAAGHEHNIQFIKKNNLYHIISGGGGLPSYVAKNSKDADFACACTGFSKLTFYENGDVFVSFIKTDKPKDSLVFQKKLFNATPIPNPNIKKKVLPDTIYLDSLITTAINKDYDKVGKFHRFMMGNNYRNIWNTEVNFRVFHIANEKGGLSIIKRGGGMQTKSVRLEDKNGKQYVLRSVNKTVEKALPEQFRKTIAVKPVQDAISASNPYAALSVPILADALGVLHTNPKLVWVPDDIQLGEYREDLANNVFLFEERPAGNREDLASFGHSKKIISTAKVIHKTQKNAKHIVDQKEVLKARLLDILINDWDRHDDQWRWASFKRNGKTIYKPIPRDRDQVYFLNEGFLPKLSTITWPTRKFQDFDFKIQDVKGLGYNARYFDRAFLNKLNLREWFNISSNIQQHLTDSIIHKAILSFPKEIYDSIGIITENKLKSRRDLLLKYAEEYYKFLSKTIDIVGTNNREKFIAKRYNNGDVAVAVFSISDKNGSIIDTLYNRLVKYNETKEIRLYGLDGKDVFSILGKGKRGIKIRIIGGKGDDTITDTSNVSGLSKKTLIYDRKDKHNTIIAGKETKLNLSKQKSINTYNRKQFKYNNFLPLLWAGYTIDDGIFIGGGLTLSQHKFRDSTIHKIKGNYAFDTGATSLKYEGLYSAVSQKFDLTIKAEADFPRSIDNFYGLGNETSKITNDKTYYRTRYKYNLLNPMLTHTINQNIKYSFGAFYQYYKVTDTVGRFISDIYPYALSESAYRSRHYTGINSNYTIDTRNNKISPNRGILWESQILGYYNMEESDKSFIKLQSDVSFYMSFTQDPRVVFALRFGGGTNFGDYEFYHANYLGGNTNLRGFRNNRFAGDYSFYQNSEIRVKLSNVHSYIVNGQLGVSLFNDIGRVWINRETSNKWHDGYGVGIWLIPFNLTAINLNYNKSKEDGFVTFKFKYLF